MTFVCRRKRSHCNYASHQVFSGLLTSLNLVNDALCGVNHDGEGTYDASGIQALASALADNTAMASLNLEGFALPRSSSSS